MQLSHPGASTRLGILVMLGVARPKVELTLPMRELSSAKDLHSSARSVARHTQVRSTAGASVELGRQLGRHRSGA